MILLDTNICIYVINSRPPQVLERFREYQAGSIGVSTVTACELTFGVAKSQSERNNRALQMFLSALEILPFDEKVIWHYGNLRYLLEKQGNPIGPLDTMIAAHALSLDTMLVTNNVSEFSRVPHLRVENWV